MAAESREPARPPVRPRFGRVPGFGQRPRIEAGACPTCGSVPPCDYATDGDSPGEPCRSIACDLADWPHAYHPDTCPKPARP